MVASDSIAERHQILWGRSAASPHKKQVRGCWKILHIFLRYICKMNLALSTPVMIVHGSDGGEKEGRGGSFGS